MKFEYLLSRCRSLGCALRGARWLVLTQAHARLHLVATLIVVGLAMGLKVSLMEGLILVWSLAAVWMAEAFNTALELLADEVSLAWRDRIGKAKDMAAFAVLVVASAAAITGIVIFGRRFLQILG
jgi:diacylglycerol kinase